MKEIDFNYDYLRAAVIHAAKQDVRFYLCGVYLGDGYMAATDGHKLIIINDECFAGCDYILPRDSVDYFIKKNGSKAYGQPVRLTIMDNGFNLMELNGNYEYFKFIEGKFPDISRVDVPKPDKPEGHPMFNIEYLAEFLKSYRILIGNKAATGLNILTRGDNLSAYIELGENSHGILMPMRA